MLVGTRAPVRPARVPTLVVAGAADGLVLPVAVRRLAQQLDADYLELDVAHNFSEEPAGQVVEDAVVDWLDAHCLLTPPGAKPPPRSLGWSDRPRFTSPFQHRPTAV